MRAGGRLRSGLERLISTKGRAQGKGGRGLREGWVLE